MSFRLCEQSGAIHYLLRITSLCSQKREKTAFHQNSEHIKRSIALFLLSDAGIHWRHFLPPNYKF